MVLEISTPTEPHSSPQMNTYFKMQQGSGGGAFNPNTREAKAGNVSFVYKVKIAGIS